MNQQALISSLYDLLQRVHKNPLGLRPADFKQELRRLANAHDLDYDRLLSAVKPITLPALNEITEEEWQAIIDSAS